MDPAFEAQILVWPKGYIKDKQRSRSFLGREKGEFLFDLVMIDIYAHLCYFIYKAICVDNFWKKKHSHTLAVRKIKKSANFSCYQLLHY